jgi:hypothetical protein
MMNKIKNAATAGALVALLFILVTAFALLLVTALIS